MINDRNPEIIPKFIELEMPDNMDYWDEEFVQQGKDLIGLSQINTIYVYDESRNVYLCELTPSYEMHAVYCSVDYDREKFGVFNELTLEQQSYIDELEQSWRAANSSVDYFHCSDIDRAKYKKDPLPQLSPEEWSLAISHKDGDIEKAYEELLDDVLESVNGNPSFA